MNIIIARALAALTAYMIFASAMSGCSTVIYERKKDDKKPVDEGVETRLKLQGPRAVVQTQF